MSELLTFQEAARRAQVSIETIRYWIKTKRLATVPGPLSVRSGKPWGKRIESDALLAAAPKTRTAQLKSSHPGNLLTVREIRTALQVNLHLAYKLVKRYSLEKTYVDRCTYLVDGEKLADAMEDDLAYVHLLRQRRPSTLK